jgi:hypothetical protein
MNRTQLRRLLDKHFDDNELRDLSFDLSIDYENLPAIAKKDKARELISHVEKAGRLSELLDWIKEERPQLPWDEVFGDTMADPAPSLDQLIQEYDTLRDKQDSGDTSIQTRHLDSIIAQMRDAAVMLPVQSGEIRDRLAAWSEGARMSGLAFLYVHPQVDLLHELLEIKGPPYGGHRPNEEYHALLAIQQLVNYGDLEVRPRILIGGELKSRLGLFKIGTGKVRNLTIKEILSKLDEASGSAER